MASGYHRSLDDGQLRAVLAAAGVPWDQVTGYEQLDGGTYNTVYRVRRASGSGVVVKVAPDRATPILAYEQGILGTEARFYELAAGPPTVPLPALLHAELNSDLVDGDYVVMTECPGEPWYGLRPALGDDDHAALRRELGRHMAALHTVTGPAFGYPAEAFAPLRPTWRAAFLDMVDAILADAGRYGVDLPRPVPEVRDLIAEQSAGLDVVTRPVLVHFDLWDGNILVDRSGGTARVGGLIDAERAFWGDPVADFVSLALFRDIERDDAFLDGYRAAGGTVTFDDAVRHRLLLYRTYLYLIMWIEVAPRGFDDDRRAWLERMVLQPLAATFDAWSAGRS